jgi:hypothetical protein
VAPGLAAKVGGLSPLAGGRIDVGSGSITVAAGLGTEDLLAAIRAGRGDGSWNGASGITSSDVAASAGSRTLGWLEHGDGSVTVAFAAAGDTNLDGSVDIFDVISIATAEKFNSGLVASWQEGDFNDDGKADVLDLVAMTTSGVYGSGSYGGPAVASSAVAVPEPATVGLITAAALAAGIVRARRFTRPSRAA